MLSILWWAIVAICLVFGLIGCFINKFPGPLLVLVACLVGRFCLNLEPISWGVLGVITLFWILSVIINKKVLPKLMAKIHEFSKAGSWGCTVGVLLGSPLLLVDYSSTAVMWLMVILDFIVLPYLFALAFEFIKVKKGEIAVKAAGSAYTVYIVSTVIKLLAYVYAIWAIFNIE